MILRNLTNKKTICKNLKACNTFLDRSLGLLLKSNPRNLLFKTRFGIHTFFLKKTIDVVVLDEKRRVINLKNQLAPNRLFFWNPRHQVLIELEAGSIKKSKVRVGDTLKFTD